MQFNVNSSPVSPHVLISLCFLSAEFGMKEDLRKIEAGGISSRDLYVKREFQFLLTPHATN